MIMHMREDGNLDDDSDRGGREKNMSLRYILKVELVGLAVLWDVVDEERS